MKEISIKEIELENLRSMIEKGTIDNSKRNEERHSMDLGQQRDSAQFNEYETSIIRLNLFIYVLNNIFTHKILRKYQILAQGNL